MSLQDRYTDPHVCGINKFLERDIDMLMAEELRVNPEFCQWVINQLNVRTSIRYPAIHSNVSVVEDGSEADVVATFECSAGLYRLYIENKIDAQMMPDQLERYLRRAQNEMNRGEIQLFSVLFFTPTNYLPVSMPAGVTRLTFEDAAMALRSQMRNQSLRCDYRASLLEKASPLKSAQARDAQVAAMEPYVREWWDRVYAMLEREFDDFFTPPRTRYPRSVFFAPQTYGMASYLRVDFKGHKGEVDLAFKNVPLMEMGVFLRNFSAVPGRLIRNRESSALRIDGLLPFVIADGTEIIPTKVRACYQAAYDLLTFWKNNRKAFDDFVARFQ